MSAIDELGQAVIKARRSQKVARDNSRCAYEMYELAGAAEAKANTAFHAAVYELEKALTDEADKG